MNKLLHLKNWIYCCKRFDKLQVVEIEKLEFVVLLGACPTGKLIRLISWGMKYYSSPLIGMKFILVGLKLSHYPYMY